jgi:hypothetical protein
VGAGRINLDTASHLFLLQKMAKNALRRWRTADISHTDKQDFNHPLTI